MDLLYFWYLNAHKVTSLFSQLNGRLESERVEQTGHENAGKVSVAAEVGGILSTLGLGKLSGGAEASGTSTKVLEITSTLSPESRVVVLLEYLHRNGQLRIVDTNSIDAHGMLAAIKNSRFQVLRGDFDLNDLDPDAATARYESRSRAMDPHGAPLITIPMLGQCLMMDQATNAMSEGDFWPNVSLVQTIVRPGKFIASPIAMWRPERDETTDDLTYWSPRMVPAEAGLPHLHLAAPDPTPSV